MTDAPTFAATLRTFRQTAGMSQSKLGQKAGLCHSYISRLESEVRFPTREAANVIAGALSLNADDRRALLASAGFLPEGEIAITHGGIAELRAELVAARAAVSRCLVALGGAPS